MLSFCTESYIEVAATQFCPTNGVISPHKYVLRGFDELEKNTNYFDIQHKSMFKLVFVAVKLSYQLVWRKT